MGRAEQSRCVRPFPRRYEAHAFVRSIGWRLAAFIALRGGSDRAEYTSIHTYVRTYTRIGGLQGSGGG